MPNFSEASKKKLSSCHFDLQVLFSRIVLMYDCTILAGHRNEETQEAAFVKGVSKLKWPKSKHNSLPSKAIDVAPYPIDWGNIGTETEKRKAIARFYHFAGYVKRVADELGLKLRWGGDWDSDLDFSDQNFDDLPHWEIID